jgi:putative transposase
MTSGYIAQVCADTRVQLIHSTRGVPQGRGKVERFFETFTTKCLLTRPGTSRTVPAATRSPAPR